MKKILLTLCMLPLLIWVQGCAPATYEIEGYTASSMNPDIPVPTNAKLIENITYSDDPNLKKGANYELKHIGGEQGLYPPMDYFQKLADTGWVELEEKRLGNVHFLKKDTTVIAIEIREDTFQITELVEGAME
ncbi:hypothetical protein PAEAM_48950 [Paenibacillus sp. GM1FR]|uniref:hypothetical protein n=1 Tax=Paenibacillus sp. GM1FR TaxID=2059267 RepID=UPI000C280882|nr:hypothetical protein [Paenibacillus sp. GM1FR]PJN50807.1 hypothetical protein PAEAM_48950 [Paenibacillus sp. GM1FR]